MAKHDSFEDDFKKILRRIPEDFTLGQWQHAYKEAIYLMGLEILERFPEIIVGPTMPRRAERDKKGKGGHPPGASPDGDKGGIHPNACVLACLVLQSDSGS